MTEHEKLYALLCAAEARRDISYGIARHKLAQLQAEVERLRAQLATFDPTS